ncbi:specifically androgen-regulated gene protein isoform X2 [Centroberyx affinis]|uniref:specifically androgen-regulated gene protein isoform X2 n=1 Tax=Centroberyx affinis TaxID=166261 RepID=UPI003A5BABA3
MPKSDTWPGGVAMESLSNMDSAGSCDSVISMNSGFSDDSLEHLSAEERACLMYLEETIEALEVQEDSGLSNDEPDSAKTASLSSATDVSSLKHDESGRDQKSFLTCGVPTPLLLANGVASLPLKVPAGTTEPETPELPTEPVTKSLPIEHNAEHHALNQASEPQTTPAPALSTNMKDLEMSTDLKTQPEAPVTESVPDSTIPPSATQTEMYSATDGDNNPKSVPTNTRLNPGHFTEASEIDLGLIPPPSDFMDEPGLHQTPEEEKTPVGSPVTPEPPSKLQIEVPVNPSTPATPSDTLPNPLPEAAEPRSPPAVAPKPKKLPSNIILKSHKASVAGSDGNSGHSVSSANDRLILDPQRVRMEALRKLGLLRSDEADSGPVLSPKLSPKSRRSWAAPASPISPAATHTPTTPSTPSPAPVSSPAPASVPFPSSAPATMPPPVTSIAAVQAPDILPAPAAFSDTIEHLQARAEPSPPLTPPVVAKQLAPPRVIGVKSATLERSGMGLSSYMASQEFGDAGQGGSAEYSLGQLRNTRPRPASLGSGKEFSSVQGEGSDTRKSLPAPTVSQHAGDSQKLPRSHGISVLICPRAKNGEDRREALKKLGLLRD